MIQKALFSLLSCDTALPKPWSPARFFNKSLGIVLIKLVIRHYGFAIGRCRDRYGAFFARWGKIILVGSTVILYNHESVTQTVSDIDIQCRSLSQRL